MDCDGFCIRFLKKKLSFYIIFFFENESLNAYNFSSLEINIYKKNRYFNYHKDALMISLVYTFMYLYHIWKLISTIYLPFFFCSFLFFFPHITKPSLTCFPLCLWIEWQLSLKAMLIAGEKIGLLLRLRLECQLSYVPYDSRQVILHIWSPVSVSPTKNRDNNSINFLGLF